MSEKRNSSAPYGGAKLAKPQLFLVEALDLIRHPEIGILNNTRLLEIFNVESLLNGTKSDREKRAKFVHACAGLKPNLARSLSAEEQMHWVQRAMEVGDTDAEQIFNVITSEDLVTTQDPKRIWEVIYFEEGWSVIEEPPEHKRYMVLLLEKIFEYELLGAATAHEMYKMLTPRAFMSDRVPEKVRISILRDAIARGEPEENIGSRSRAQPYTAADLIRRIGFTTLVECTKLSRLSKILYEVARMHGWVEIVSAEPEADPDEEEIDVEEAEIISLDPSRRGSAGEGLRIRQRAYGDSDEDDEEDDDKEEDEEGEKDEGKAYA